MAFCPNCGSESQGNFCAKCGSQIGTATASAGSAPPPPPPPSATAQSGLEENVASALCYALGLITGILFIVLEPYNRNRTIRFHAFQSIFVHIGIIIGSIVVSIVNVIPFIGWLIWMCYFLGVFILWLMLMYKAYNRERWVLPVVGPMAEKQVASMA